jgi:hypothetical protein
MTTSIDRPFLSSERAPQIDKTANVWQILKSGCKHQMRLYTKRGWLTDWLTDWPIVCCNVALTLTCSNCTCTLKTTSSSKWPLNTYQSKHHHNPENSKFNVKLHVHSYCCAMVLYSSLYVTLSTIFFLLLLLLFLVGWEWISWYWGHYWPIVPASDDRWWWLSRNWWNEEWQGKPKYSEKTFPSTTLSTTNPTWLEPGLNPGCRGGKPATNRLSYGAAFNAITDFWGIIHVLFLFKKKRFGDWALCPSSDENPLSWTKSIEAVPMSGPKQDDG